MGKTTKIFDGLLVLQYKSGNKNAMTLLVKRHHELLCRHAYWYTHDIEVSKDIVQESWRTILHKIGSLKNPNSFGSWAMSIVTRKSLDHLNKVKVHRERQKTLQREYYDNDETEEKSPDIKKMREAIKKLPDNQKEVLRLFYTEEYSLKEISAVLKISEGTVKSRLFHAREKLKTILK